MIFVAPFLGLAKALYLEGYVYSSRFLVHRGVARIISWGV